MSAVQSASSRVIALGDLQTNLNKFLSVLRCHDLLTAQGDILDDVHLVAVGDYFDYGDHRRRHESAKEGSRLLQWLLAQSAERTTLLVGNHELARVGEFVTMTDKRFQHAVKSASELYPGGADPGEEARFFSVFPEFPSTEVVARDFSSFLVQQRELVKAALRSKRLRVAAVLEGILFSHAGVTTADLLTAGHSDGSVSAESACQTLNSAFDRALASWDEKKPFEVPGLHSPGSHRAGEGGGIFFHRPTHPQVFDTGFDGNHRRRYDPRKIPLGVVQAIDHVRDKKCRSLLGDWVEDSPAEREGGLRSLVTDGERVSYRAALGDVDERTGVIIFLDGGMHHVQPEDYQLLDVKRRRPARSHPV